MDTLKIFQIPHGYLLTLILSQLFLHVYGAVSDLSIDDRPTAYRKTRDDRYPHNRYTSSATTDRRTVKPESVPEARDSDTNPVEKRCIRCTGYVDPYDYRDRDSDRDRLYYDRYDDRRGYDDRYDYRYDRDRYDKYDNRYDRYDKYDRYDTRYDRTYSDRDRWYDRRPDYDRYDHRGGYDRYDGRSGYSDRYDRYDNRGSSWNDYRGIGYDNRGYDYRKAYDNRGFRPWDETTRGSSGFDTAGRGYYFATGRPEPSGYWGYDRGYASSYNYGRGDSTRDPWYSSRPRDPYYEQGFYRGTSYLYDRNPSSNTSTRPPPSKEGAEAGVTDRPDTNPGKSSDNSGSG